MQKAMSLIIMVSLCFPLATDAEKIYTWKDENGVSKFSNSPPPENVTVYEVTETSSTNTNEQTSQSQRRSSFDQMVRQTSNEAAKSKERRKERAAAKAAEQKRILEEQEKARRQAERNRLENKIEAIKKRAVSPTFPNGMKQAQIDALRKKIENLGKGSDKAKGQ